MELDLLHQSAAYRWEKNPTEGMNVPAVFFGDESLIKSMEDNVLSQLSSVAFLPGIVQAAYVMPDGHSGYGFPIGGVAAFDPENGGIVCAGGVGFDISCGVRTLTTQIPYDLFMKNQSAFADSLFRNIPCGLGQGGPISLSLHEMDDLLQKGAVWAVERGYGKEEDLLRIESYGKSLGADPLAVSEKAKMRQLHEMGTLGSGNHYAEVQVVEEIYDEKIAAAYGIRKGCMVVTIHCGSRGLGHQIATEYSKEMLLSCKDQEIVLENKELASAPIYSSLGQRYLGAMRSAINCALANRQILSHFVRDTMAQFFPDYPVDLLYDVSHNTCLEEEHLVHGQKKNLFVHRKGATRALPPGHKELCEALSSFGQPVIIGGSMGTSSYILSGVLGNSAFASACHGAGREMSRTAALKKFHEKQIVEELQRRKIELRSSSRKGIVEEAPEAYKNIDSVIDSTVKAGLAKAVARVFPVVCIKG